MIRWLERLAAGEAPIIFGDGTQTMDFVYVKDVARCNLLAMASDVTDRVFNVGSGTETSLRQLCTMLCEATGHPEIEPQFAAVRKVNPVTRRLAAVDAARDMLGFESRMGLAQGLLELVEWHSGILAAEAERVA
jgi:UDP-glucose 4-epimerase